MSATESEKSPKTQLRSLFFWDSFRAPGRTLWDSGALRGRRPGDNLSDSFGVPGPKGPGDLCARPGGSHLMPNFCVQAPRILHFQGKTPCVDQSYADCPGFPVLGAGDAPPPELHPGGSKCAPGLAFVFMALRANFWICCPQLPYHRWKNGTHSTCFCSTRGHTPTFCTHHKTRSK